MSIRSIAVCNSLDPRECLFLKGAHQGLQATQHLSQEASMDGIAWRNNGTQLLASTPGGTYDDLLRRADVQVKPIIPSLTPNPESVGSGQANDFICHQMGGFKESCLAVQTAGGTFLKNLKDYFKIPDSGSASTIQVPVEAIKPSTDPSFMESMCDQIGMKETCQSVGDAAKSAWGKLAYAAQWTADGAAGVWYFASWFGKPGQLVLIGSLGLIVFMVCRKNVHVDIRQPIHVNNYYPDSPKTSPEVVDKTRPVRPSPSIIPEWRQRIMSNHPLRDALYQVARDSKDSEATEYIPEIESWVNPSDLRRIVTQFA